MKKLLSFFVVLVVSFCFIGNVSAEELAFSDVATLSTIIGGSEKEITLIDTENTYKLYYKYVEINSTDFQNYVGARYVVENSDVMSDEYADSTVMVSDYAATFKGLIPEVTTSDLESWTLVVDDEIVLGDLAYQEGYHNGYVLAVAAVQDGDANVYIDRLILESTSSTTLGNIAFTDSDVEMYGSSETVATDANPDTGLSDYVIYLVPVSIIMGSVLLFRRSYC